MICFVVNRTRASEHSYESVELSSLWHIYATTNWPEFGAQKDVSAVHLHVEPSLLSNRIWNKR